MTASLVLPGAGAFVLALEPDLQVVQIREYSNPEQDGDLAVTNIVVTVMNSGTAPAPASDLLLEFRDLVSRAASRADEDAADAIALTFSVAAGVPEIAPGLSADVLVEPEAYAAESPTPGGTGRWHLTATADASDIVAESDESNNSYGKDVTTGSVPVREAAG